MSKKSPILVVGGGAEHASLIEELLDHGLILAIILFTLFCDCCLIREKKRNTILTSYLGELTGLAAGIIYRAEGRWVCDVT